MHLHATATVKLMCSRFFCFNNRVLLIISDFDGLSSSSLFEKAIKCHKVGLCLGMPGVHVFLELAVVWRHLALVVQLQSCCPWGGALAARAWTDILRFCCESDFLTSEFPECWYNCALSQCSLSAPSWHEGCTEYQLPSISWAISIWIFNPRVRYHHDSQPFA